jgi:phosphoglycolate phosphatase-like HAD superfamily hydrolase
MATTLALFDVDGTLLLTHDDLYVRLMIKTLSEVSGTTLPLNAMSKVEHKARPVIATAAKRPAQNP